MVAEKVDAKLYQHEITNQGRPNILQDNKTLTMQNFKRRFPMKGVLER